MSNTIDKLASKKLEMFIEVAKKTPLAEVLSRYEGEDLSVIPRTGLWASNPIIGKHYLLAPYMVMKFSKRTIPNRCKGAIKALYKEYELYMKLHHKRFVSAKAKKIITHLVKNLSRCYAFSTIGLRYTGAWQEWSNKHSNPSKLSLHVFNSVIDWLDKECHLCMKFSGSGGEHMQKFSNFLLFDKEFISWCNTSSDKASSPFENGSVLEEELRYSKDGCLVVRKKYNNVSEDITDITKRKHRMTMESLERALIEYNTSLAEATIEIDGHVIPELFFRRIYADDLDHGGRYYDHGEVLSHDKKSRNSIMIDGKPTVSLDLHYLHPAILYSTKGIDLEGRDPYGVEVEYDINDQEVEAWKEDTGCELPNVSRNLAKLALLCMINSKDRRACTGAISEEVRDDRKHYDEKKRKFVGVEHLKISKLIDSLIEQNKEIESYFFSGAGLLLQNMDSNMIELCIKDFVRDGQVLIPVHDCIIVRDSLEWFGRQVLTDAYEAVVGTTMNCIIEKE